MNGINKHVTETSEEIPVASVENRGTGKPIAKAKPRPKPTLTLTPLSIPCLERKWIDVEPGKFTQGCFEVSEYMIRLLRHDDTVHREDDGVVRFDELAEKFKAKFDVTSQWPIDALNNFPGKRRRTEAKDLKLFLYFRAIQGHSGENLVDPALQDNVLLPEDFTQYIYHIGNVSKIHSTIRSGLIPGRRSLKKDRQSVFFTADASQDLEEVQYDLDKPRIAVYKNT